MHGQIIAYIVDFGSPAAAVVGIVILANTERRSDHNG